jgi:class 3 adenylate cyclase/tetratricopeptide (TPR) repeat protein
LQGSERLLEVLEQLGLTRYVAVFQKAEIDDGNLPHLTEAHLREIGIPLGPSLKIAHALTAAAAAHVGALYASTPVIGPTDVAVAAAVGPGEHRQVTVLYCDLVHSTELTHQLGNERYAAFHAEYVRACKQIVAKYDQDILQQKGDGIGVCFGLRRAREDDPEQAVRAAIELTEAVSNMPVSGNATVRCRIGIGTGVVAVVSSDAFGDVMNLASRLQDVGGPGDIIVSDSVRRICGDSFAFIDIGHRPLKGFAPQRVWRVGGTIQGISRFDAIHGQGLSPLTGRDDEQRELHRLLGFAQSGRPQVVCIQGEAGIGKSRLVRELVDEVRNRRFAVQIYQCTARRQNAAYYPIVEQIGQMCGIQHSHSPDEKLERLQRVLGGWESANGGAIQVVTALMGIEDLTAEGRPVPSDLAERAATVIAAQFKSLAERHPAVIVFEDVHWMDSSSGELLTRLIALIRAQRLPILLILTCRPAEEEDTAAKALFAAISADAEDVTIQELSALERHESFAIITHVAKGQKLPASLLESIAVRADDVPLFVEEVTKYVLEFGKLYELDEHQPVLLERVQPYLTGRLDGLGKAAREVAQVGAVIGRRFTPALIAHALECDVASLEPLLAHLVRSELVYKQSDEPNAVYAFKHALVQDTAYASLFVRQKRRFHRRIGEALEREYPELASSEPDVLAWHFTEARDYLRAINYWCKAGEAAIARSAMSEARSQFERGEKLVRKLSKERAQLSMQDSLTLDSLELDLLAKLGVAVYPLEGSGDERLVSIFERVLELASKQRRSDREFDAHLGLANYYYVGGNLEQGELHIAPCLRLAERSGDVDQIVSAHRIAGELAFYLGDLDRSIKHLNRSIERYSIDRHAELLRQLGDDPGILARMYLAVGLFLKGEVGDAFKHCEMGIAAAERAGHDYTLGQATFDAAWLYAIAGQRKKAKEYVARSIALCSNGKDEFRLYLGCSSVISGWITSLEGDAGEGVRAMKRAFTLIEDAHAGICLSCFLPWLAEGLGRMGEVEEALRVIEKAHECTTEHFYDAERLRIEGELCAGVDPERARDCFRRAIETSSKSGMTSFELRALLALRTFQINRGELADPIGIFGHLLPWIERETQSLEGRLARRLMVS